MIRKGQLRSTRKLSSSAAILLVSGISLFCLLDRIQPAAKFATEPDIIVGIDPAWTYTSYSFETLRQLTAYRM
jgi:hypothetical protein